jgi:predicted nucleotidyltransferase
LTGVIRELNREGINYALAGGLAYSAPVEPRATTDIALIVLAQDLSVEKIRELFRRTFDSIVPHRAPMAFKTVSIWRLVGIRDNRECIVDLLPATSDFLKQSPARKHTVDFLGLALPIVTIEDLIVLKCLAGRLQDKADLEKIVERPSLGIDWDYVKHWQAKLGLQPL